MKSSNPHSGCRQVEIARTVDTFDPTPAKNQGGIAVVEAVPYTLKVRTGCAVDSAGKAAGKGALIQVDKAATLAVTQDQYLFQPVSGGFCPEQSAKTRGIGWEEEMAPILRAGVTPAVVTGFEPTVCYAQQAIADYKQSDVASNQTARQYKSETDLVVYAIDGDKMGKAERAGGSGLGIRDGDKMYTLTAKDRHAVAYGVDPRNLTETPELYQTLQAKSNGGQSLNYSGAVRVQYIVRRLTPTECARLQGFADMWGYLDAKDDFTDEEYSFWLNVRNTHAAINGKQVKEYTKPQMLKWYKGLHTDSAEYKLWGNGIALPPALYCMQGISDALNREEVEEWML